MTTRHAVLVVWALLGAAVAAGQVVAALSGGRFPGLGPLVARITARPVGRVVMVLGWMWLGWHAFAR